MGRNKATKKRERVRERVIRRVCVREKVEEGEREGGREGERHRIRTTAQLQTAEAECSHGWHRCVHGVVHSSLRVDLRRRKRRWKRKRTGEGGRVWVRAAGVHRGNPVPTVSPALLSCSYQVNILLKGLGMYNRSGSVCKHRGPKYPSGHLGRSRWVLWKGKTQEVRCTVNITATFHGMLWKVTGGVKWIKKKKKKKSDKQETFVTDTP